MSLSHASLCQVLTHCFHFEHLKLHIKLCEIQLFQSLLSSVLKGLHSPISQYEVDLVSFITLTPSLRQFPFTIRLYYETQGSKIVSDSIIPIHSGLLQSCSIVVHGLRITRAFSILVSIISKVTLLR